MKTGFHITGLKETLDIFQELENDIGDKKARSKVLIPAAKEAMKPVLSMAKSLAPKDTSLLANSLATTGRRPNKKDRKSAYISANDTVIAMVATKPIPRKLKQSSAGMNRSQKRKLYATKGIAYDGRVMANEFGTANMSAQPFLRVSLESQAVIVAASLGRILKDKIEKYRSKSL